MVVTKVFTIRGYKKGMASLIEIKGVDTAMILDAYG